MNLLNKYKDKKEIKKINPSEIINKSAVSLVFEEDKDGNLQKYSFAKANPDGSLTVLHNGKNLKGYQTLCHSERTYAGAGQGCVESHITVDKMIGSYSSIARELVYFKIKRNLTSAESKELDKVLNPIKIEVKNALFGNKEDLTFSDKQTLEFQLKQKTTLPTKTFFETKIWPTLGGVFVDEKNIFSTETKTATVQELLDFEVQMNKILFNNSGKNYPEEYEDVVLDCREQQKQLAKKSHRIDNEKIMII